MTGSYEWCFVSLGANEDSSQGTTPQETVRRAAALLMESSPRWRRLSPLYLSEPVDCPPGTPHFVNAIVMLCSSGQHGDHKDALDLLDRMRRLEADFGRRHDSPTPHLRPLDLDIIQYGLLQVKSANLTVPHPRAHQRRFVLQPMLDLVLDDYCFPGNPTPLRKLLEALPKSPEIALL